MFFRRFPYRMVYILANLKAFSTFRLLGNLSPKFGEQPRALPSYTALSTQRVAHGVIQVVTGL